MGFFYVKATQTKTNNAPLLYIFSYFLHKFSCQTLLMADIAVGTWKNAFRIHIPENLLER